MNWSRESYGTAWMPVSMRMASHGQASTQKPQKMQRSSSMTNFTGIALVAAALVALGVLAGLDVDALRRARRRAAEARDAARRSVVARA